MRAVRRPRRSLVYSKLARDGQRGGGQHHGVDAIEQAFVENLRNVDGRGLQKCSAAAALDPIHVAAGRPDSIQNSSRRAISRARATSGSDFFRRRLQQFQLQRDQLQRAQHVAIGFVVLFKERLVGAESGAAFVAPPKQCEETARRNRRA